MSWTFSQTFMVALVVLGTGGSATAQSSNATPTCSDMMDIDVHGQHVIGDYVTGLGHDGIDWPGSGGIIGSTVGGNRGVEVKGGPGPGYHFKEGVAPGASFCTGSQSPGIPHD